MKNHIQKAVSLFLTGGILYLIIEILWRGHTHWTMGVVGGLCFILIGAINEFFPWNMSLILQGIIGSIIVTIVEFLSGIILNVWLNLNIWDYSNLPFNIMGQICLPFIIAWIGLSIIAVLVDDWLRYKWFNEEKPHYTLFGRR